MVVPAINSWVYVGPGLRIHLEALGPEYAFESDNLASGASIFFSRKVDRAPGGDLLEKQNAEQGLLPLLEDEAATYGFVLEDRPMVSAFREGVQPEESFHDGVVSLGRGAPHGNSARPDTGGIYSVGGARAGASVMRLFAVRREIRSRLQPRVLLLPVLRCAGRESAARSSSSAEPARCLLRARSPSRRRRPVTSDAVERGRPGGRGSAPRSAGPQPW